MARWSGGFHCQVSSTGSRGNSNWFTRLITVGSLAIHKVGQLFTACVHYQIKVCIIHYLLAKNSSSRRKLKKFTEVHTCTFIQDTCVNSSVWKGDSDHAYYLFTWHRGRQILGWRTSRFMEQVISTSKGTVLLASARCQLHRPPRSFIRWVRPSVHILNDLEVLPFWIFPL